MMGGFSVDRVDREAVELTVDGEAATHGAGESVSEHE
jgi:hypothetical protein